MRSLTLFGAACGVFGVALLWTRPAHAYIDPGTASMIFQMAIAGLLGALVSLKVFWSQIKSTMASVVGRFQKKTPDGP